MSIHIAAKPGEIADKILLPGDPLRAKFIAENFLEDAVCFNEVRNMFGYTGTYKGHRVSVMGTGMGIPSISIYAHELIVNYGVKRLIRVGTAGSLNKDVHVRELVLAQAAATNSNIIRNDWPQYDFPQIASFHLLDKAYHIAKGFGMTTHVGNVLSSDVFYSNYGEKNIELGKMGVLAVEMEYQHVRNLPELTEKIASYVAGNTVLVFCCAWIKLRWLHGSPSIRYPHYSWNKTLYGSLNREYAC